MAHKHSKLTVLRSLLKGDKARNGAFPLYQRTFRVASVYPNKFTILMHKLACFLCKCEIPYNVRIGKGLYIAHPYCITINGDTVIGEHCNISRSVLLGGGKYWTIKGAPMIGNKVWIGVNAAIVGHVTIGDDVMIAANTFVNRDIPPHSIVFGNPCVVKYRAHATEGYI